MVDHFIMWVDAPDFCLLVRAFSLFATVLCASFFPRQSSAQGWGAEEMSNPWVKVTIVPQLGADCEHPVATGESSGSRRAARGT